MSHLLYFIFFSGMVAVCGSVVIFVCLSEIQEDFGFSETFYGALAAIWFVIDIFTSPYLTHKATAFPPMRLLAFVFCSSSIGCIIFIISSESNEWVLFFGMVFVAPTQSYFNLSVTLVDMYSEPDKRSTNLSLYYISLMIGATIGAGISVSFHWRAVFAILLMMYIPVILWQLISGVGPQRIPRTMDGNTEIEPDPSFRSMITNMWTLLQQPRYFGVWLGFVLIRCGIETYISYGKKYYEDQFPDTDIAVILGILAGEVVLATIIGQSIGGAYTDRIKNEQNLNKSNSSRYELSIEVNRFTMYCIIGAVICNWVQWGINPLWLHILFRLPTDTFAAMSRHPNSILWSTSVKMAPYAFPNATVGSSCASAAVVGITGIMLNNGISYNLAFYLISILYFLGVSCWIYLHYTNPPGEYTEHKLELVNVDSTVDHECNPKQNFEHRPKHMESIDSAPIEIAELTCATIAFV